MARPSARSRLLDCAERLFGEHGLGGVSLRAINAEAGLSPAALHYHFGNKQVLLEAVIDRRMSRLMQRRAELLEEVDRAGERPEVRAVVAAMLAPLVELIRERGDGGLRYVRLLARLHADGDLDHAWVTRTHPGGVARIGPLLRAALPHLSAPLLALRLKWAIDTLLSSLAGDPAAFSEGLDLYVAALLDFVAGGLTAPLTGDLPCPSLST